MSAVSAGLRGALLLARGRPEGLARVHTDRVGTARSFWAAAICLPAFACLRLLDWSVDGWPAHPAHGAALDLLGYAIGWAGYAVAAHPLVRAARRAERWPLFIATWNWCNVAQYALLLVASIPSVVGSPSWVSETTGLVAMFWALWLEWYAARLSLQVSGPVAAGFVALDVAIGAALSGIIALLR